MKKLILSAVSIMLLVVSCQKIEKEVNNTDENDIGIIVKETSSKNSKVYKAIEDGKVVSTLIIEKIDEKKSAYHVEFPNSEDEVYFNNINVDGEITSSVLLENETGKTEIWIYLLIYCTDIHIEYNNNTGWSGSFDLDCGFIAPPVPNEFPQYLTQGLSISRK